MAAVSSERPGVLIVDDAALIRRMVADIVTSSGEFTVAAEVASGAEAVACCAALDPHIVTLDLEMPGLGGLETLGYIMSESPRPVVVLSGGTSRHGEDLVVQALQLGAVDFVRKPSVGDVLDFETLRVRVLQALHAAKAGRVAPSRVAPRRPWRHDERAAVAHPGGGGEAATAVLVIAASTGGPKALVELCADVELPPGTAGVIAQHMPSGFTQSLAQRLDDVARGAVRESQDGHLLRAGEWSVLGGGHHWVMRRTSVGVVLREDPTNTGTLRPAADPVLGSAVETFGRNVIAIVLTGMGRDGAHGAALVRAAGGKLLVQAPDTAAIGSMPQAALTAAAGADWCGPLGRLPAAILSLCDSSPRVSHRA
jgi:two-component system chemotaxis response regulator CheB